MDTSAAFDTWIRQFRVIKLRDRPCSRPPTAYGIHPVVYFGRPVAMTVGSTYIHPVGALLGEYDE